MQRANAVRAASGVCPPKLAPTPRAPATFSGPWLELDEQVPSINRSADPFAGKVPSARKSMRGAAVSPQRTASVPMLSKSMRESMLAVIASPPGIPAPGNRAVRA